MINLLQKYEYSFYQQKDFDIIFVFMLKLNMINMISNS